MEKSLDYTIYIIAKTILNETTTILFQRHVQRHTFYKYLKRKFYHIKVGRWIIPINGL